MLFRSSPVLANVTAETEYKLPNIMDENPGLIADELRRNLVQPVILGNGPKIKKVSREIGSNVRANQQILLLTDSFEEVPDMYGWTKSNLEKFADWTNIEIEMDGDGNKVVDQSIAMGTSLKETKKITITLGE